MNTPGYGKWAILIAILIVAAPMSWFMVDNRIDSNEQVAASEASPVPCEQLERSGLERLGQARREGLLKVQSGDRIQVEEAHWERLPALGKGRLLSAYRCSTGHPEVSAYGYRREAYLGSATENAIELAE